MYVRWHKVNSHVLAIQFCLQTQTWKQANEQSAVITAFVMCFVFTTYKFSKASATKDVDCSSSIVVAMLWNHLQLCATAVVLWKQKQQMVPCIAVPIQCFVSYHHITVCKLFSTKLHSGLHCGLSSLTPKPTTPLNTWCRESTTVEGNKFKWNDQWTKWGRRARYAVRTRGRCTHDTWPDMAPGGVNSFSGY